ncbi:hypothetical protein GN244_ATG15332 [Phytophthora infestans]|uniref:Uncharacterized protein n=1 Tax=Phytophthora infestans TaxID=4787 RepID=A0A833VXF7_PHYIN|nr:hypothetical protein GN244_ATG15332 [Phytophthora infestans]
MATFRASVFRLPLVNLPSPAQATPSFLSPSMAGKPRKSRSASASAETKAPRGKRSASVSEHKEAIETTEPPRKKAALLEDNEEPGPEPTKQLVARLELKLQELGAENERLKEKVEKLQMEQVDSQPKNKKKKAAKAQPKDKPASTRAQPKRKSTKGRSAKV